MHTSGTCVGDRSRVELHGKSRLAPQGSAQVAEFAKLTFPDDEHRLQWWSPVVAKGHTTAMFEELESEWANQSRSLKFVINEEYTLCINKLVEHARQNKSATAEDAYRVLQVLTRLKGERPKL